MQLAHYRPWGQLTSFPTEMNRLFGDLFGGDGTPALLTSEWAPPLDVAETEDAILVKAEVPGLDPSDLDVSLKDGVLTIRGEKKSEREEKGKDFHRVERTFGTFSRTVALPCDVDGQKTKATYKNGVVELHLPKKEEARRREIKIQVK